MKFWKVFNFELGYQLRRAWFWLFVAVLIVLSFLMTRDGSLAEVLYAEFFLNSPFAVAKTTVFGSLIWMVMAAAIAGEAAARELATGMYPLTYTAPISKADYLGGRFFAALVLNALMLLSVQAGILLGVYLPGVDAQLIGPFRPAAFITAYAFISLPNAFFVTAVQFSLALRSGRAMAGYFGSFLFVFLGFFVSGLLLYHSSMGTLLDPIGIRFIVEDVAHLWTTVEKNKRLLTLEGIVLNNRLLWVIIGLLTMGTTFFSFQFRHRNGSGWLSFITQPITLLKKYLRGGAASRIDVKQLPAAGAACITDLVRPAISVPQVQPTFGFGTHLRQTLLIAATSFRKLAWSWAGIALLVVIPLMTVPVVLDQMQSKGVPLLPTTAFVISELTASLSDELSRWVIIPFLIIYFAGELVWREREAGMGEITDTMPGSDWTPFLGKFLGLGLVLVVFLLLQIGAGMLAQVIFDYHDFEIGLYLKVMLGLQLIDYLLFTLLALAVHVVVNQKYVGHLVAVITFVFITLASLFGIEHNLLIWGAGPGWTYTEMRGFGPSLMPWFWFKFYWVAWALLLAVVAKVFWVRGRESSFQLRLKEARSRFRGVTTRTTAAAIGLILVLGVFIFYNTNILNDYISTAEIKERQAEYERRYGKYAKTSQPRLTATKLQVEIYPERREVAINGTYSLVNRNAVAIDTIHLATRRGVETAAVAFNRQAVLFLNDEELNYQIYALEQPLQPGESLLLSFRVQHKPQGFREGGIDASVVENGTYFTNAWLPAIGYQESRELLNAPDRRAYNLPQRPLIASLYNQEARKDRGEGISFEAVVGTQIDQQAVAPGALRRTWTEAGRRYFHYKTDNPIGGEWAFFSANYSIRDEVWQNPDSLEQTVRIRIYHKPDHTAQLDRMVRSIRASLDYYTKHFGPYEYSYLSVVERAGNGTGMHADASMLTYTEGFARWMPKEEQQRLDVPFAVVAHEMAHQWTVPYANVEGAPVMSESLAWYYAMKVVEKTQGNEHFQHFLSWMRQPYRREIRRGEPLLRGLDPYMSYRKGPFALYTLHEYIGEEPVHSALRQLLEKHSKQEAPLATTLDLYRELLAVTPDTLQYMLHDLFEVNTHWEITTQLAKAKQTVDGDWEVAIAVEARKLVFDSTGVETEVPMNDWVQLGVLSPKKENESNKPLYLQMHRIGSGKQTIRVRVSEKPARAGLDPNFLLIDSKPEDNVVAVKIE